MTNEHILSIATMEKGEYKDTFVVDCQPFATYEQSEIMGGQVTLSYTLKITPIIYHLSLHITGFVELTCDRCLQPMQFPIDCTDDLKGEIAEAEDIDLLWCVYENLSLQIPIAHYHPQGECDQEMAELSKQLVINED